MLCFIGRPYEDLGLPTGEQSEMLDNLPFDVWMTIHGSLMLLAWGLLAPSGVYVARYLRYRQWFPIHRGLMLMTVLSSALGSTIGFLACESHFNKPHKILAPIINSLMILQMIGGMIAHAKRDPSRTSRPVLNQMHRITGGITMILGWTNICLGVYDNPSWPLPLKWSIVGVYFGLIAVIFGRSEWLHWKTHEPVPSSTLK